MDDKLMTTVEILSDGKIGLNVFTENGWIFHKFSDIDTMKKYFYKAAKEVRLDVV